MREHLFSLLARHERIDREIQVEQVRRLPDPFRLQRLKRLKLAVKDRLAKLMRRNNNRIAVG